LAIIHIFNDNVKYENETEINMNYKFFGKGHIGATP
jgi:hypothetical protein